MDAILLAGGFGTRLRPLTYTRPKPLLPVGGKPMLEWALDRLPPEVDRVIVAVNWLADRLEAYFQQSNRDMELLVVREDKPLGTGGAIKNCAQHIRPGPFFVLNGDIISDMDLGAMLQQHEETKAQATIALKRVPMEQTPDFGVAAMDDEDPRRIVGFVEKPPTPAEAPSDLINAGAYILQPSVLKMIPHGRLVSLEKEIFPELLDGGLYGMAFDGLWVDVGDPERVLAATAKLPDNPAPGLRIHDEATIQNSAIGARCRIGRARVVDCVLGDDVLVEDGADLEGCVVGDSETVQGEHRDARIWSRPVPEGYPDKQVGNAKATPASP